MTDVTEDRKEHVMRDTILAGVANYIDSGSIVAGAAALAFCATNSDVRRSTNMTCCSTRSACCGLPLPLRHG